MDSEFIVKGKPHFQHDEPDFLERLAGINQSLDEESKLKIIIEILRHLLKNHNASIRFEINFHK